jgi:hypothetical protein
MAAIRRLEARQKPVRPGPGRDPKKPATVTDAVHDLVEPGQDEPAAAAPGPKVAPAAVAADAQAPLAPEVPADDPAPAPLTMTEAAEPETEDDPGLSTAEAIAEKCRVEPISGPTPTDPGVEKRRVEPISEPAPADLGAEKCRVEPISGPAVETCVGEPVSGPATKMPDFERFGPYAGYLRNVQLMLEAKYGDGGSSDAPGAEPALPEGQLSGTSSRPNPGDVGWPATPPDGVPRESYLAKAMEQRRLRNIELSRQLDEHFGINGNRPAPGWPPPVSDG